MPTYDYRCPVCGHTEEIFHSIKINPEYPCPDCEKKDTKVLMSRVITASVGGFIMHSSPSMALKEKNIREKRNADLEMKQIERWSSSSRLQPNVGGMEVETWNDAAKLAKEAGMNEKSYEPLIEKEKRTSKDSGVDDKKWKDAKDKKDKS